MNHEASDPDHPPVPWNAVEIVILVFLVLIFWQSVVNEVLRATGFFAWYYPGETPGLEARQLLWLRALAFPFQVATVPLFLALLHGVRPAQLGLTRARFARNLWLGTVAAVVLTPLVLGLFQVLLWLNKHYLGATEEEHPLARLAKMDLSRVEWMLWVFAAVIAAPVIEELLFRGVFQAWARKARWGGAVGVALAAVLAVALRWQELQAAVQRVNVVGWSAAGEVLLACAPLLFVLALLPVFVLTLRRSRNSAAPAIFGTSLLFAMVHVAVWPSPVALFILALGLGTLKERTHSLVGPITLHSLFNAVSCALLFFGAA